MTTPAPVSALHEIHTWSSGRPDWQKDALRRIILQSSLPQAELAELARFCRAAHGCDDPSLPAITPQPLAAAHLPQVAGTAIAVSLVSVGSLVAVNRIATAEQLNFGPHPGLTVVYGENGSGKSGFARVIRKACRTRGTPPQIKPDAFVSTSSGPAKAEIAYTVSGSPVSISWTDGVASDPRLSNIFVFDSSTASNYLDEDGPAAFTPSGLDVLTKLTKICDAVDALLAADIAALNQLAAQTAQLWKLPPETGVSKLLATLSASTPAASIDALAVFTDADRQRLAAVADALKSNPKQKAKETRASAARLRAFRSTLVALESELSETAAEAIRKSITDAHDSAEVAKKFATGQFDGEYLNGTGGILWPSMWNASRDYSTADAYKDKPFPVVDQGAKCVLCQQTVDSNGSTRFTAFDAFVKDQSQQVAAKASKTLTDTSSRIAKLLPIGNSIAEIETDLSAATPDQATSISVYATALDTRLASVVNSLRTKNWTALSELPASPVDTIEQLAQQLDTRSGMEESADKPEERAKLVAERDDLAAREWLVGARADVLAQVDRAKRRDLLEKCRKDATTAAITKKNTELTKQIVTDAFTNSFEKELGAIGLKTVRVQLEELKGKKGETRFGVRLVGASGHKVADIASEGEQRCIALAIFLAELSQASHQSALVFDDPVSSLDHHRREKIAVRLVEEAKVRQVIVLTHDAVFLNDLQVAAESASAPAEFRHIEWNGSIPGHCKEGLPWDQKSAADRVDKLEKDQIALAKVWAPQPTEANVLAMREIYGRLRASIERLVEKHIFADVLLRFRGYVNLKGLDKVIGFDAAECAEVERLFKKASDLTLAHDAPTGKQASVPDPSELKQDIADMKALLAKIKARTKHP